jgi:hypothetical protein
MADCQRRDDLEKQLINIRCRHKLAFIEAWKRGASEEEQEALVAHDTPEDIQALLALLDHIAEHGCGSS